MRQRAHEKLPPGLQLPKGFRLEPGPIVTCAKCSHRWRVPDGMTDKLSDAAWSLLLEHAEAHKPVAIESYCPLCRDERTFKISEGQAFGRCTVCRTTIGITRRQRPLEE